MVPHIIRITTNQLEQSAAAEAVMSFHIVMHHQSFRSADCHSALFPEMFNESLAAQHFASKRTKATMIAKSNYVKQTL